jgi:K+-transporting ATPase ATPase C chain
MSSVTTTPAAPAPEPRAETILHMVGRFIRPAIALTLVLTVVAGILYPLTITGIAQAIFPSQANGSLIYKNGQPIASSLIGQYWTQPQYFHGRPSATSPTPYNASNSGGSNLGPTNPALQAEIQANIDQVRKENPDVPDTTKIPIDLVTSSASGLDPDISVAGAYYQVPRIAKARGMTAAQVEDIINAHIQGRFMGIFGEDVVNVLELNMALDKAQGK